MPLGQLPIHILEGRDRLDAHPAEQDDHAGAAGGDEAQDEGVLAGAVVALQDGVAEGTLGMELDLVGPGPDEVVDEVGAAAEGAGGVAQPLAALDALGDGGGIVDAAVPARVRGKAGLVVRVEVVVPLVVGQLGGGVGLTVSITVVTVTVVVALFLVATAVLVIALLVVVVVVVITTAFFFRARFFIAAASLLLVVIRFRVVGLGRLRRNLIVCGGPDGYSTLSGSAWSGEEGVAAPGASPTVRVAR